MKLFNTYIGLLLAISASFLCHPQIKIDFFEVGQGHCTLICCDESGPILVDAGCLSYAYTGRDAFRKDTIKAIVTKINRHADETGMGLTVIVSHPDPDHFNWLQEIMTDCTANIVKVVLGGSKKFYTDRYGKDEDGNKDEATFQKYLTGLSELEDSPATITYLTEAINDAGRKIYKSTYAVENIIQEGPFTCEILPAKRSIKKVESNDASLVVHIKYGNLACILLGDATGKTLDHIMKYWGDIGSVALCQSSHHGADPKGCNRSDWIKKIAPECVVFSSGIVEGHRHPHVEVASRILEEVSEECETYHLLYTGRLKAAKEKTQLLPLDRVEFTNGYRVGAVNKPVYGTLSQGTLTFSWEADDVKLPAVQVAPKEGVGIDGGALPTSSVGFASEKIAIFSALLHPRYGAVGLTCATSINLNGMRIDDTCSVDKEKIRAILSRLITHGGELETFSADKNELCRNKTMDLFIKLIETQTGIKKLSILRNRFADGQMARLIALDPERNTVFISRAVAAMAIAKPPVKKAVKSSVKEKLRVSPCD